MKTIDPAQRELVKGLLVGWGNTEARAESELEKGISVNENGDVTEIRFMDNTPQAELPAEVPAGYDHWDRFLFRRIHSNLISGLFSSLIIPGEIPTSIGQLSNLTILYLPSTHRKNTRVYWAIVESYTALAQY